jgi:hypothetical protein
MKQLVFALCTMGLGFVATAQTNTPEVAPPPSAPGQTAPANVPEPPTTTPDNSRYLNDKGAAANLKQCEDRLAAFNDKPCDIVFIGDSVTTGWLSAGKAIWEKSYAPRHALNFGVSGDTTQNVL